MSFGFWVRAVMLMRFFVFFFALLNQVFGFLNGVFGLLNWVFRIAQLGLRIAQLAIVSFPMLEMIIFW